jgi:arylsulfatase A
MDDAFGRLMRTIDERGQRDNTLVLFTSDNGPAITAQHPHGSAGPLRDKKGSLYEGGIRVPGILRWPGKAKAGAESDEPISGVDFLPTVCAITGIAPPRDRALDGASILPALSGDAVPRTTPLYWHFNRAAGTPKVAMRVGDWKILATLDRSFAATNDLTDSDESAFKEARLATFSLYNLRDDLAETRDRAASDSEKLAELRPLLERKYLEVRGESPLWPAWKFTGVEGKRIEWPDYVKQKATKKKQ